MNVNMTIVKKVAMEVGKVAVKVGLPLASSYVAGKELDAKVAKAVAKAMENQARES